MKRGFRLLRFVLLVKGVSEEAAKCVVVRSTSS